jgi:hypothetical protein
MQSGLRLVSRPGAQSDVLRRPVSRCIRPCRRDPAAAAAAAAVMGGVDAAFSAASAAASFKLISKPNAVPRSAGSSCIGRTAVRQPENQRDAVAALFITIAFGVVDKKCPAKPCFAGVEKRVISGPVHGNGNGNGNGSGNTNGDAERAHCGAASVAPSPPTLVGGRPRIAPLLIPSRASP